MEIIQLIHNVTWICDVCGKNCVIEVDDCEDINKKIIGDMSEFYGFYRIIENGKAIHICDRCFG